MIRLSMRVDDHKQVARRAHAKGDKPLLIDGIRDFAGKREIVQKNCRGFRECNAMVAQVCRGLLRIPIDSHLIVWTIVCQVNPEFETPNRANAAFLASEPRVSGILDDQPSSGLRTARPPLLNTCV